MSKKSSWMIVIIITALFLFIGVLLLGTYRLLSPAKIDITENSVLELNFSGEIPELPPHSPWAQFVQRDGVSLYELGRLLHVASQDPHIVAIHLSSSLVGV